MDLIRSATQKAGGIYLYANQQGCDGDRLYYDGCALIAINGEVVAQGSQFSLADVEVITATVDLEEVRSYRAKSSRNQQASRAERYQRVQVKMALSTGKADDLVDLVVSRPQEVRYHLPEEEIACALTCETLLLRCTDWPMTRQTGTRVLAVGLPPKITDQRLLCPSEWWYRLMRDRRDRLLHVSASRHRSAIREYVLLRPARGITDTGLSDGVVIADARRIAGEPETSSYVPLDAQEFCGRIFHTCYMGTENSSVETRKRAKDLSKAIGRCVFAHETAIVADVHAKLSR